ncbi:hypothetical protein EGW08_016970 [Elysia chlorotica]|uniref:Coiled-coil domain-containing protein 93 n=1 Tax=Elysia chlorotica TaxID=188477 RepID=A0A3S1B3L3_ELYCH|nr:hypothetical protein EGW08_016970 [Elysia chlorotica]
MDHFRASYTVTWTRANLRVWCRNNARVNLIDKQYTADKEKLHKIRLLLAKKNREIAGLQRKIDEVPSRAELSQYQRRFLELYNQVASKHTETKQFFTLYNTLEDTKTYLNKESWSASWMTTTDKFTVHDLFWQSCIAHSVDMTKPLQAALTEGEVYAHGARLLQNCSVGYRIMPRNANDSFGYASVDFGVKRQVAGAGGSQIGKFIGVYQHLIVNGDGKWKRDFVTIFIMKECISHTEFVEAAQFLQYLTILIHISNSTMTQYRWSRLMVSPTHAFKSPKRNVNFLNSIHDNFQQAMNSIANKEAFLKQFEQIVESVKQNKIKAEKKRQEEKMKRDQLADQHLDLVEKQRLYFKTVKDFKEECRKNEILLSKLRAQ